MLGVTNPERLGEGDEETASGQAHSRRDRSQDDLQVQPVPLAQPSQQYSVPAFSTP
jgi:hypothetical protein